MSGLIITPETKVGDLLDGYPEAEAALIDIAPKFKALKNPVLRRTVAKVATLEQAARVADIPVNELVRSLRQVLGQEVGELGADGGPQLDGLDAPPWIADGAKIDFDADALLAQGATPVGKASEALAGMDAGEV
ncbi:MAG: DUF1858 domain-containing protein, partial [Thermoanaerobaculales bacterium]